MCKRIGLLLAIALLTLSCCNASADGEIRQLPIDLSGGAPYTQKYSKDLEVYEDPSIRVERYRVQSKEWGCTYYYAIITIKDPSQLRTAPADHKSFISTTRLPVTRIAKRVNAVLAINGDYTGAFSGQRSNSFVLRQGTVYRDTVEPNLDLLLIDEDGDFHVVTPDQLDLAAMDKTQIGGKRVVNAFQFGPALVIDGEKVPDEVLLDYGRNPYYSQPDHRAQRLCIAQIGPLQYMVVCNAHYGTDLVTFRDLVLSIAPCQTVYTLDGGGSTQMVFLGTKINNVQTGEQEIRNITDIVYFCSAWFTD
ncbi:MAG: phosphodiester glycosidase family protein [Acidaminococcaceae bacterium]|nr:phosphodiester glycosidase family protein [Acidaminococcaceae bacterium]